MLRASINATQWERALKELGKKNATKAGIRTVNRTLTSARSSITKLVSSDMGLQQKVVREYVTVSAAKDRGMAPYGVLYASTKRVPLIQFKAKESKRGGVTAKLPAGAGKYPNAFIRQTKSGHVGVFQRAGKARLPIYQLHGPSPFQAFQKHADVAQARALDTLDANWQHEFDYLLAQAQQ